MALNDTVLFETTTPFEHYTVVDTIYEGRPARVLYSGNRSAAQSGIATDGKPDLLFDYNQRFMELVESVRPTDVLLIGGGAYTLPVALLSTYPGAQVDVVELDPALDDIATRFFGLRPHPRLHIVHGDGAGYLARTAKQYDLILLDAFTQTAIPAALIDSLAARNVYRALAPDGVVAMNVISPYYGSKAEVITGQVQRYNKLFRKVDVYPAGRTLFSLWLPQNLLLIAQKGKPHNLELRYGALPPYSPHK